MSSGRAMPPPPSSGPLKVLPGAVRGEAGPRTANGSRSRPRHGPGRSARAAHAAAPPLPPPCCVIPFWRFCGHGVLPAPWRVPHPLAEGREGGRRGEERRGEERRRNPPAATAAAAATSGKEGGRRVGGIKSERSGEYAQPREAHAACMRLDLWIESPWYKLQSVSSRPAVAV